MSSATLRTALHSIRVGYACERFALAATARGLKHPFLDEPVEATGLRPDLAALIGLPGRRPDFVMCLGYGTARCPIRRAGRCTT